MSAFWLSCSGMLSCACWEDWGFDGCCYWSRVFRAVTPCGLVIIYWLFEGSWCISLQRQAVLIEIETGVSKSVRSSETTVDIYQSTRHNIAQTFNFYTYLSARTITAKYRQNQNVIGLSCVLWDHVEIYCGARQATWQNGASALYAGYLRLQTYTQSV